ncbi:chromate transporter, chromate ion transporter (CHR) family [Lentimicrobium saccharophilum]|uniref:Chromate transporter, chromate ion transporter (CHR) family n=1 Tax=Lentimicrobium saccharophilum TaxID=1678841 RepID=A0A0S7C3B0_9BACT|nr:chromate efflux transporter [Lentimicrobium saccharophilum]GAP44654.1 chromate transporter, chromate ion transporter (CHR) family [Lentimicrobium saccharophilum]
MHERYRLREVALVFLKLGFFSFGGPAAHTAMMEEEVVKRRKWIDRQHFLDLLGATNLIPGPNSTEMTMHCGHERAGLAGLIVAGLSFILPAVLITSVFAWLYVEYGHLPEIEPYIFGIKPAVLAIIASAIISLGKKAVKGRETAILGALVLAAGIAGVNEITALLVAGITGTLYFYMKNKRKEKLSSLIPLVAIPAVSTAFSGISALGLFWVFLKIGAVLYGSGYVLFAYIDAELVTRGWLDHKQLMDAIAVGQFTPGPILSTVTFIGYMLGGIPGAVAATAGAFLPSFLFVLILNPWIPRMRRSKIMGWFLDSVNVASIAVMASVLFVMTLSTVTGWRSALITVISLVVTFVFKKSSPVLLVAGGSVAGALLLLI